MKTQTRVDIRWLIRVDMDEVVAIENENFGDPWTEREFSNALRQRNCIGMVAERDCHVLGYMVYELHKSHLRVLNFAVNTAYQRQGIGSQMIAKLVGKLHHERRTHMTLEVRERNVDAQLFFKAMGFRATAVLRKFYEGSEEDAYQFERWVEDAVCV